MKIDPNSLGLPQSNPAGAGRTNSRVDQLYGARPEEAARSQPSGKGGGEDNVELSSLSHHLRVDDTASPEREARLQELARLVASGKYEVDAREVSRRIVDDSIKG
jgi:anti-sigma28 factor (negative regulator of flagellin synthesis)